MSKLTLSHDGLGIVMAGQPGSKWIVARLANGTEHLAPLFVTAPELLAICEEYERTPPDVRATPEWHTPWYSRLTSAIAKTK